MHPVAHQVIGWLLNGFVDVVITLLIAVAIIIAVLVILGIATELFVNLMGRILDMWNTIGQLVVRLVAGDPEKRAQAEQQQAEVAHAQLIKPDAEHDVHNVQQYGINVDRARHINSALK